MRERVPLVQIHRIEFVKDVRAAGATTLRSGQGRTACVLSDFLTCKEYQWVRSSSLDVTVSYR